MRHVSRHETGADKGTNTDTAASMSRRRLLLSAVALGAASLTMNAAGKPLQSAADPGAVSAAGLPRSGSLATGGPFDGGAGISGEGEAAGPPPGTASARLPLPARDQVVAEFGARRPLQWGLNVAGVVTRLPAGTAGTALTFDLCGGPGGSGFDHELVGLLRRQSVKATFFLNSRWITANPGLARELAADPLFEVANHGTSHQPLSLTGRSAYGIRGTRGAAEVYEEVAGNQDLMTTRFGAAPTCFRPGTAFYDEDAAELVRRLGLTPVNFSINGDAGATFTPAQVAASVSRAGAGDIVISHANQPGRGTAAGYARALPLLLGRGTTFVQLSDVLPV